VLSEAMDLVSDLGINSKPQQITFVGAGGKTSSMFLLAKELRDKYLQNVLITTTTNIFVPSPQEYDHLILDNEQKLISLTPNSYGQIVVYGRTFNQPRDTSKITSPENDFFNRIRDCIFDVILIEGDGSARKPIKAPSIHEPVIPEGTTKIIGVIGMKSLNQPINENFVHRVEHFKTIVGKTENQKIECDDIVKLVLHPEGVFKSSERIKDKYLYLTQVRGDSLIKAVKDIKNKLNANKRTKSITKVIGLDLVNGVIY